MDRIEEKEWLKPIFNGAITAMTGSIVISSLTGPEIMIHIGSLFLTIMGITLGIMYYKIMKGGEETKWH